MKILLVDDTELFIDLERSYLKRESFRFLIARSGEEALQSIRKEIPDLIILDLLMPGIDGRADQLPSFLTRATPNSCGRWRYMQNDLRTTPFAELKKSENASSSKNASAK